MAEGKKKTSSTCGDKLVHITWWANWLFWEIVVDISCYSLVAKSRKFATQDYNSNWIVFTSFKFYGDLDIIVQMKVRRIKLYHLRTLNEVANKSLCLVSYQLFEQDLYIWIFLSVFTTALPRTVFSLSAWS